MDPDSTFFWQLYWNAFFNMICVFYKTTNRYGHLKKINILLTLSSSSPPEGGCCFSLISGLFAESSAFLEERVFLALAVVSLKSGIFWSSAADGGDPGEGMLSGLAGLSVDTLSQSSDCTGGSRTMALFSSWLE